MNRRTMMLSLTLILGVGVAAAALRVGTRQVAGVPVAPSVAIAAPRHLTPIPVAATETAPPLPAPVMDDAEIARRIALEVEPLTAEADVDAYLEVVFARAQAEGRFTPLDVMPARAAIERLEPQIGHQAMIIKANAFAELINSEIEELHRATRAGR